MFRPSASALGCLRLLARPPPAAAALGPASSPGRRSASIWPKDYQPPVLDKSQFPALRESGELHQLRFQRIKAAPNEATCSVFHDPMVVRLRNTLMERGKKETADRVMRNTFKQIKRIQLSKYYRAQDDEQRQGIETDPVAIVNRAVENARPLLKIDPTKVGGVVYQVPRPITENRAVFYAIKWMIEAARNRPETRKEMFSDALAVVLINTSDYVGSVVERKNEHHKVCEQNRAYAHYKTSSAGLKS